jgi:hypothetical protein
MPTPLSPDQIAAKWARNLGNSVDSIRAGVQALQTSPTESAAAQQDRYLNGVQNAVSSGKWVRGLRRVSLADWQQAMVTKGLNRVSSGATAAIPKMTAFQNQWQPFLQANAAKVRAMPKATLQDRLNRMVAMATANSTFKRQ